MSESHACLAALSKAFEVGDALEACLGKDKTMPGSFLTDCCALGKVHMLAKTLMALTDMQQNFTIKARRLQDEAPGLNRR